MDELKTGDQSTETTPQSGTQSFKPLDQMLSERQNADKQMFKAAPAPSVEPIAMTEKEALSRAEKRNAILAQRQQKTQKYKELFEKDKERMAATENIERFVSDPSLVALVDKGGYSVKPEDLIAGKAMSLEQMQQIQQRLSQGGTEAMKAYLELSAPKVKVDVDKKAEDNKSNNLKALSSSISDNDFLKHTNLKLYQQQIDRDNEEQSLFSENSNVLGGLFDNRISPVIGKDGKIDPELKAQALVGGLDNPYSVYYKKGAEQRVNPNSLAVVTDGLVADKIEQHSKTKSEWQQISDAVQTGARYGLGNVSKYTSSPLAEYTSAVVRGAMTTASFVDAALNGTVFSGTGFNSNAFFDALERNQKVIDKFAPASPEFKDKNILDEAAIMLGEFQAGGEVAKVLPFAGNLTRARNAKLAGLLSSEAKPMNALTSLYLRGYSSTPVKYATKYLDNFVNMNIAGTPVVYTNAYAANRMQGDSREEASKKAVIESQVLAGTMSVFGTLLHGEPHGDVAKTMLGKPEVKNWVGKRVEKINQAFNSVGMSTPAKIAQKTAMGSLEFSMFDSYMEYRRQKEEHNKLIENGQIPENTPFKMNPEKLLIAAKHGAMMGGLVGAIGVIRDGKTDFLQGDAVALAIKDPDQFKISLQQGIDNGYLTAESAKQLESFVTVVKPKYLALEGATTPVFKNGKQVGSVKMDDNTRVAIAVRQARLAEIQNNLDLYKNKAQQYDERKIIDLEIQAANEQRDINKLETGTVVKGQLFTPKDVAKMAKDYTERGMLEKQRDELKANGAYKAETVDLEQFKTDEDVKAYLAVKENSEAAQEFKTQLDEIETKLAKIKAAEKLGRKLSLREQSEKESLMDERAKLKADNALFAKHLDILDFSDPHNLAPVIGKEGNIIDGKKRIAAAIAKGDKNIEVLRPLTEAEHAEMLNEREEDVFGANEPNYEGLDVEDAARLRAARAAYDNAGGRAAGVAAAKESLRKGEKLYETEQATEPTSEEPTQTTKVGVVGDVEVIAKELDRVGKENPIKIEETEFGSKLTGGIIDVKIKAIQGDKKGDVKTPSTLNFLPKVLELVHLARNKKDKGKIISNGFNAKNVSIDSPIAGIYFSSEDWSTMDRFGRSKEDGIYTTIENDGLLYFDSSEGLRDFLKENNLPSEGQTLNAAQMATLKNMGVKGILLREDFASQSRNELIVIDESIIKGISEKPISGVTKLPSSFSNTKDIAEAYLKAKADGSNPELVKAVEQSLKETPQAVEPITEEKLTDLLSRVSPEVVNPVLAEAAAKMDMPVQTFKPNKILKGINDTIHKIATKLRGSRPAPRLVLSVSVDDAKRIADAYEEMKHDPNNPEVKRGFEELVTEIKKQADALLAEGYTFELTTKGEGYGSNSEKTFKDVKENKRILVESSEESFGTDRKFDKDNIGLMDSGYKDVNGRPLTNVELIRGVHDLFGHSEYGNGFGAIGEENAWRIHMSMFSPLAQKALTATTRGQNSWVNFGKHMRNADGSIKKKGDEGYMDAASRPFAEQKIGFLPDWATDNAYGDVVELNGKEVKPVNKFVVDGKAMYDIDDPVAFRDALIAAKENRKANGKNDWIQVHAKTEKEYEELLKQGGHLLVSKDGKVGIAVGADGFVGSGFAHVDAPKGALAPLLNMAIKLGARYTDAFDTYLPEYYAKFGFKASGRMKFDEAMAEEGWGDTILKDKPDVVFMYYDGGDRMTIDKRFGEFEEYSKTDGEYVSSYDEGVAQSKLVSDNIEPEASLLPVEPETKPVSETEALSPKNMKDLYNINRELFGLNRVKALASAAVMDRMIGAMAKRAGISKADMYSKLEFRKDVEENLLKVDNALFQAKIGGKEVTLRNTDVDVVNGFYSPLEKIIKESKQDKLPVKQWIEKFAKGEEAKWTGLQDWLAQQEGSLSKQEVLDFLKNNRVSVVEVVKDSNRPRITQDNIIDAKEYKGDNGWVIRVDFEDGAYVDILPTETKDIQEAKELAVKEYNASIPMLDAKGDTKYSNYQLGGEKENYKEILVTLPVKTEKDTFKSEHFDEPNILVHLRMNTRTDADGNKVLFLEEVQSDYGQKGREIGFSNVTQAEYQKIKTEYDDLYDDVNNKPLSEEYRRNLNIVRNKGLVKDADANVWFRPKTETELSNPDNIVDVKTLDENTQNAIKWLDESLKVRREKQKKLERLKEKLENSTAYGAPSAPFVMNTPDWVKLGLKVALKEAVKQGADKIAWTTGEQQNDRYSLEKQVDEVFYAKKEDGTFSISANKDDKLVFREKNIKPERLEAYIGKELASKIIEDSKTRTQNSYKGDDLKVGGKGMKGFYGSSEDGSKGIVGGVAKSLFKQEIKTVTLGGKTGSITRAEALSLVNEGKKVFTELRGEEFPLHTVGDVMEANNYYIKDSESKIQSTQFSIDITPELRSEVERGLALFQKQQGMEAKGAMVAADSKFIVYALTDPNVSTPVHELAHVFEHYLTDAERAVVQSWAGTEAWTTKTSESFARGFEKYLADGKAPSSTLQKVFDKFKEWLTDIYNGVKGSDIDLELNDQMRELYSKMVEGKDVDSLFSEKGSTFDPKAEYEASFEGKASSRAIREAKMPFIDKYFKSIVEQLEKAKKITKSGCP